MKPSEKIKMILSKKFNKEVRSTQIMAVLEYLDEEHEQKQKLMREKKLDPWSCGVVNSNTEE